MRRLILTGLVCACCTQASSDGDGTSALTTGGDPLADEHPAETTQDPSEPTRLALRVVDGAARALAQAQVLVCGPVIDGREQACRTRDVDGDTSLVIKTLLSPEQYHILREGGTERALTGKYEKNKAEGLYKCAGCGLP